MNKSRAIRDEILRLLAMGCTNKRLIYDEVIQELGVPRPTVRRVARDLRIELMNKIAILNGDVTTTASTT